jgi:hypothetical protein
VRRALAAGAAGLLLCHAPPLEAQDITVRVGGLHTRYADSLSGSAGSLAGRVVISSPRSRLGGTVSVSQFTTGSLAGQAGASALVLRPLGGAGAWSAGLLAQGNGSWLQGGTFSGVATAGPILAMSSGPWLAWLAGEAGGLRRIDATGSALVGASAHVRLDLGSAWGVDAAASATGAGAVRYQDYTLAFDGRLGAVSAGVTGGTRAGGLGGGPWVQGQVAWRLARSLALEVEGGRYPADLTGFTHGVYVAAGLRIGLTRDALLPRRARAANDDVRVEHAGQGRVRVVFRVPGARHVAIAGEWNEWAAAPLTARRDGRWEIVLPIRPGAYRFSLIVDGDRWTVPPGVPAMDDDFGGRVGLLVISS